MFTYWTSSKTLILESKFYFFLYFGFFLCRMHLAFYCLFRDIFLLISFSSVTITHNYKTLFLHLQLQSFTRII